MILVASGAHPPPMVQPPDLFSNFLTLFKIVPKSFQMAYFDLLSRNLQAEINLDLIFIMKIQNHCLRTPPRLFYHLE